MLATATTLGFALSATIRMVNGVANHSSGHRADPKVTSPTRFAKDNILPLGVAHLTNGREALFMNLADLPGGKPNLSVPAIARHQRRMRTCRTHHLSPSTREQLDVMNRKANRNVCQREGIPRCRGRCRTTHYGIPNLQTIRTKDVRPLGVGVLNQSEPRSSIRIVLNSNHFRHHPNLPSTEIYAPDLAFVTTTPSPNRDSAVVVPPASPFLRKDEGLLGTRLRYVRKIFHRDIPGRRRERPKCFHELFSFYAGRLSSRVQPSLPFAWGLRLSVGHDPNSLRSEDKTERRDYPLSNSVQYLFKKNSGTHDQRRETAVKSIGRRYPSTSPILANSRRAACRVRQMIVSTVPRRIPKCCAT